jgi:hypothetical protein
LARNTVIVKDELIRLAVLADIVVGKSKVENTLTSGCGLIVKSIHATKSDTSGF